MTNMKILSARSASKIKVISTSMLFYDIDILQCSPDMAVRSTDVMWAGVVTWKYNDHVIRIRSYRDKPLINFLPHHSFGEVYTLFTSFLHFHMPMYIFCHFLSLISSLMIFLWQWLLFVSLSTFLWKKLEKKK